MNPPSPGIVAVASGKGGAGKTSTTLSLAWALAESGQRVCILDADLGLSNVDVLLGVNPPATLEDVLFRGLPLEEAIVPVFPTIDLISGSSGVARMAELSRTERRRLVREFAKLSGYDTLLVDNSPGISPQVLSLCLSAQEIVVVVNPEITSITDSYALIKVLRERGLSRSPLLLINRAQGQIMAHRVFSRIQATTQKYLGLDCRFLGLLPEDGAVQRAAVMRRPVLSAFPAGAYARCARAAALRLSQALRGARARALNGGEYWDASVRHLQLTAPRQPESSAGRNAALAGIRVTLEEAILDAETLRSLFQDLEFAATQAGRARVADQGLLQTERLLSRLRRLLPPALARTDAAQEAAPAAPVRPEPPEAPLVRSAAPARPITAASREPQSPPAAGHPPRPVAAPVEPARTRLDQALTNRALGDRVPFSSPPRAPAAFRPAPQPAFDPAALPAGLVVSEHPVLGSLVSEILRDMGLTPRLTTPAGFDREAARQTAVCVVVAPRADAGLNTLLAKLNGTPVIYLDGSFGRESGAIRNYPGVRAVIGYPFRVETLRQAIAEQLSPVS